MERGATGKPGSSITKQRRGGLVQHTSRVRKFTLPGETEKKDLAVKYPIQAEDATPQRVPISKPAESIILLGELDEQQALLERFRLGVQTYSYFQRLHVTVAVPSDDEDGELSFDEASSLQALAYATIGQAYADYEHCLARAEAAPTPKAANKFRNDFNSAECFMYPRGRLQEERTMFVLELAHLPKSKFVLGNLTLSATLGRPVPAGVLPSWIATKER